MTLTQKIIASGITAFFFLFTIVMGVFFTQIVQGEVNFSDVTDKESFQSFNFFSGGGVTNLATTTTATSTNLPGGGGAFKIAGAKNVNFFFGRGATQGANTGSTVFKVQVSDGLGNWFDYNFATTTAVAPLPTFTIAAATSTIIAPMYVRGFYSARCIVVETTDGEHTCKAIAEF